MGTQGEHKETCRPSSAEEFRARLRTDHPGIDPSTVLHSVRRFAEWRGDVGWPIEAPKHEEIWDYLTERSAALGDLHAATELAQIQVGAPVLWDVAVAGMIGMVLRKSRCHPKIPAKTIDEKARAATACLPEEWRANLVAKLSSEPGRLSEKWSAHYLLSVAYALARWHSWCFSFGKEVRPCGTAFQAYANDVRNDGVSEQSAADYLSRITSGYHTAVDSNFQSMGCAHVVSRLHARAKVAGRHTKTGQQIVGASTIFDLGMEIMEDARDKGPRGLHTARNFRNGLLLSFAAALPQRSRALSFLKFQKTLTLLEEPYIQVALPGHALKLSEAKKRSRSYDRVLKNLALWTALNDYQRDFRPLFDNGDAIFPSILDIGAALSSSQLSRLVGDLTFKHLGVRVSIHRVRDNVATEASEELQSGGYLAPALLGHESGASAMASYDHAQGMRASKEFGDFLGARRSDPTKLRL